MPPGLPHVLPVQQQRDAADHNKGDDAGRIQQLSLPVGTGLRERGLQLHHQGGAEAEASQGTKVQREGWGGAAVKWRRNTANTTTQGGCQVYCNCCWVDILIEKWQLETNTI